MEHGPEPDLVGDALARALGYQARFRNPYPRISGLLRGITTAEGVASDERIQDAARFAYADLSGTDELPAARTAKVEKVTDLAIGRLRRGEHLLAAREDVRDAADSAVPPDPGFTVRGQDGTTLGDVEV